MELMATTAGSIDHQYDFVFVIIDRCKLLILNSSNCWYYGNLIFTPWL